MNVCVEFIVDIAPAGLLYLYELWSFNYKVYQDDVKV